MVNNILKVNSIVLALTGLSIIGILLNLLNYIKSIYKNNQEKTKKIENAVQSLLKDTLLKNTTQYITSGYITKNELASLTNMYTNYKNLGGNSFVDNLYSRASNLKISKDII